MGKVVSLVNKKDEHNNLSKRFELTLGDPEKLVEKIHESKEEAEKLLLKLTLWTINTSAEGYKLDKKMCNYLDLLKRTIADIHKIKREEGPISPEEKKMIAGLTGDNFPLRRE